MSAAQALDAVRDVGALYERLLPGFATAAHLEGDDRVVMFFTGTVLRERLVTLDDEPRRLVWSIVDGPYNHHNGTAEVFADEDGACRLVWTADLLPDREAERTSELMDQGSKVISRRWMDRSLMLPDPDPSVVAMGPSDGASPTRRSASY